MAPAAAMMLLRAGPSLAAKPLAASRTTHRAAPSARSIRRRQPSGIGHHTTRSNASSNGVDNGAAGPDAGSEETSSSSSMFARFKGFDRKKLAAMGSSVLLSYGFVSNVHACTIVTVAWVITFKTTGLSPLAAGNWPKFLGIYGGLYLSFGNLLRPARVALAVAISPLFDRCVKALEARLKIRKAFAFGLTVFLVNVLGSFTYFGLAITGASVAFGIPMPLGRILFRG